MTYFKVYQMDCDGEVNIIKQWMTESEAQWLASVTFNGYYTEQSEAI